MEGDVVPDDDHVSRCCFKSKCSEIDGRPLGTAFQLRRGETYLSVNWLEFLQLQDRAAEIAEIRRVLAGKLKLKRGDRLAVLHVETSRHYVKQNTPDERDLKARHEPDLPADPSHSGIFGLRHEAEDDMVADLLAQVIREVYPAV